MELRLEGTPAEIQEFLKGLAKQQVFVATEPSEESQTSPISEIVLKSLVGNEAQFLPVGVENAVTGRTIVEEMIHGFPGASPSDITVGLNRQVVNHLKALAEKGDDDVAMIDNSSQKAPYLFYRPTL